MKRAIVEFFALNGMIIGEFHVTIKKQTITT